jgi:hypothetical protein
MKRFPKNLLSFTCLFFALTLLSAQDQEDPTPVYAEVLFIEANTQYSLVEWEKLIWKPIYAELIQNDFGSGWQLFSVEGQKKGFLQYNYAVVHYYASLEQLELTKGAFERAFKAAHPDKSLEDVLDKSQNLREIVYREVFRLEYRPTPLTGLEGGEYLFLQMKRVPLRKQKDFREEEKKRSIQMINSSNPIKGFENRSLWKVVKTDLSSWDYNFVIIERWNDKALMLDFEKADASLRENRQKKPTWKDIKTEVWVLEDQLLEFN